MTNNPQVLAYDKESVVTTIEDHWKPNQRVTAKPPTMRLGCKGQARPCSRSIGDYDGVHPTGGRLVDGVQGRAKSPLGHGGVGGAGTLSLTGDATAIRCTGFDDLHKRCPCLHRRHLGKRTEIRRGRLAGGDATGHAQRVPLAKVVRYYRTHLAISAKRHLSHDPKFLDGFEVCPEP